MYEELVKRLKERAECFDYDARPGIASDYELAADAIEDMNRILAEWDKFAPFLASHGILPIIDKTEFLTSRKEG